jgi:methylmalonyl-CoA mutase N-terminal domain/subunit
MGTMQQKMDHWERGTLMKVLEESPEREKIFKTESGIPTQRVYTPLDLEGMDYRDEIGFPGDDPYTRGVYPTMYRGRLWTMRNYSGFGTAEDTNKRYRYLLEQGMAGLSITI